MASNIVVGVGFLGGGAILKEGIHVRGLTTAASLWVTAAIGLGSALGAYWLTVATTALVLGSLVGLRGPRRWLSQRLGEARESAVVHVRAGGDPSDVVVALEELPGVRMTSLRILEREDGSTVRAELCGRRGTDVEALLATVRHRDDVVGLELARTH